MSAAADLQITLPVDLQVLTENKNHYIFFIYQVIMSIKFPFLVNKNHLKWFIKKKKNILSNKL